MEKSIVENRAFIYIRIIVTLFCLLFASCQAEQVIQSNPSQKELSPIKQTYLEQGMIELIPDSLPMPVLPENPVQADLGEMPYYQICIACHGNWGQGLTDEWREIGFNEDMNCWQSKCHASNHPPQGFEFPHFVPPLLGSSAMSGITNARQLYQSIYETMPWWSPRSLTEEEALNITAYIMRARDELPEGVTLTMANLSAFSLHSEPPKMVNDTPLAIILISGLSIAMFAHLWIKYFPKTRIQEGPPDK